MGEVIAASQRLRANGLTERGFHALIAIAEKCHTAKREGSVPWSHIRAGLYGASPSTAKRAVQDLKAAGLLRVIKRGFDNQNGRSCAPIYRIETLSEQVTQVTQSPTTRTGHSDDPVAPTEQVTQVTQSTPPSERVKTGGRTGQIDDRTGQNGDRTGHPGDLLNGSTNGSTNGPTNQRGPRTTGTRLPDGWQPPPDVVAHMRSNHPHIDLDYELDKFRDHWTDQPGAKGRKVDWIGTYRNWIRRAAERPHPATNNGMTAFERKKAANAAVFQALGDGQAELTP